MGFSCQVPAGFVRMRKIQICSAGRYCLPHMSSSGGWRAGRSGISPSSGATLARENLTEQNTAQKASLPGFADGGTAVERVIFLSFDSVEDGQTAAAEH